jgi:hypothetical protein
MDKNKKRKARAKKGNKRVKQKMGDPVIISDTRKKPINTPQAPAGYSPRTRRDMSAKRAVSPNKMKDYGKPTSPVAMRMSATKSGLPMKESPAMMYGGNKGDMSKSKRDYESPMAMRETPLMKALVGNQDKLPEALQAEIKASPAKMYGGKKGDMSKSKRDY